MRHGSLNSLFQVALPLPFWGTQTPHASHVHDLSVALQLNFNIGSAGRIGLKAGGGTGVISYPHENDMSDHRIIGPKERPKQIEPMRIKLITQPCRGRSRARATPDLSGVGHTASPPPSRRLRLWRIRLPRRRAVRRPPLNSRVPRRRRLRRMQRPLPVLIDRPRSRLSRSLTPEP